MDGAESAVSVSVYDELELMPDPALRFASLDGGVQSVTRTKISMVSGIISSAGLLACCFYVFVTPTTLTVENSGWVGLALFILGLLGMSTSHRFGSAQQIYFAIFSLFHLGLIATFSLQGPDAIPETMDSTWLFTPAFHEAVKSVSVGILALVLGALLFGGLQDLRLRSARVVETSAVSVKSDSVFGRRGTDASLLRVLLVLTFAVGLVIVVGIAFLGGFTLGGSYGSYLNAVGGSGLVGFGFTLVAIGIGLAAASKDLSYLPWVMALIATLVFMPIGMRGAALFPLAVVVAIKSRFLRYRALPSVALVVLLLGLISVVEQVRTFGIRGFIFGDWDFAPLAAVSELGGSIYPVHAAQLIIDAGAPYWWGQSVFVTPIRLVESLWGASSSSAINDMRFFGSEVTLLFGQIGGSPIAEGIRNGGTVGIFLLMLATGCALRWVDSPSSSYIQLAFRSVVLYALLVAVRNAAAPIIVQVATGALVLFGLWVIFKMTRSDFDADLVSRSS